MARPAFLRADRCALIGMVHLEPLPGAPGYGGDPGAVERAAAADLDALASGGADAVLVENFHDAPFFPGTVPPETVAAMGALVRALREGTDLPMGVNVLRNDGLAALAVAVGAGAEFIRVNVLTGVRVTDQGLVHGIAHELLRARRRLGAEHVAILADVAVKHSAPLADYPAHQEAEDMVMRGGADALVVSGSGTGKPVDSAAIEALRAAAGDTPVIVGSGVTAESALEAAGRADALIVGTALKGREGRVDADRVRAVAEAMRRVQARTGRENS